MAGVTATRLKSATRRACSLAPGRAPLARHPDDHEAAGDQRRQTQERHQVEVEQEHHEPGVARRRQAVVQRDEGRDPEGDAGTEEREGKLAFELNPTAPRKEPLQRVARAAAMVSTAISTSGAPCVPTATLLQNRHSLFKAANHLDVQFANLLPQGVAVHTEKLGRSDLVASGRGQRELDQRALDLSDDAAVQALGRQSALVGREVDLEVALHGRAQGFVLAVGRDLRVLAGR